MIRAGYKKLAKVGLSSSGDTQNGAITPALVHDCCSRVFQSGFVEVDPSGLFDGGFLSALRKLGVAGTTHLPGILESQ